MSINFYGRAVRGVECPHPAGTGDCHVAAFGEWWQEECHGRMIDHDVVKGYECYKHRISFGVTDAAFVAASGATGYPFEVVS